MLKINNFSFAYPSENNLISNLYLNIPKQKIYTLLGSNGVGKSSVLKAIWQTSFLNQNQVISSIDKVYLSQEIPSEVDINPQKPNLTFYEIQYQLELLALEKKSVYNFTDEILFEWLSNVVTSIPKNFKQQLELNLFDLKMAPGFLANKFSLLSPGTRKKLLLSILFASSPSLIIADEITNHLDKQTIEVVQNWLHKSHAAVFMVDHNQSFVESICKNFIVIPNNVERVPIHLPDMSFNEVMSYLEELKDRQVNELAQVEKKRKQFERNANEYRRQAEVFNSDAAGKKLRAVIKRLDREVTNNSILKELDLRKKVKFKVLDQNYSPKKNIQIFIKNLRYSIGDSKFQTIKEFKLFKGDKLRLCGQNGSGKSTLLKLIQEQYFDKLNNNPQFVDGEIIISNSLEYKKIFVLQQTTDYSNEGTIYHYLKDRTELMEYQITNFLKQIELDKFSSNTQMNILSIGEFIRLQLGVLSLKIHEIELLILDEPGNFLDIFTQSALVKMLENYKNSILLVTHDDNLASKLEIDAKFDLNN
jgi:ATPase subunit of ABC transporter with duplicated ATPase domains